MKMKKKKMMTTWNSLLEGKLKIKLKPKSGQNVIGPKGKSGSKDLVDGIFNKAQQPNQGEPFDEPQPEEPKKSKYFFLIF
jgi:hypothetical protein